MIKFFKTMLSKDEYVNRETGDLKAVEKAYTDMNASHSTNAMRIFATGATRNTDVDKLDFEGFLSPLVLFRYAEYLHQHRIQADGQLRDSDNWQKGMPKDVYIKSLHRHFINLWLHHRGFGTYESIDDALCAIMFNTMGYLFEVLKSKKR